MPSKSSKESTPVKKSDAASEADAAPKTGGDDLTEVEAAIDQAQRSAGAVAEGVDQASIDAVQKKIAGARAEAEAGKAGDAMNEIVAALEEVENAQQGAGNQPSLKQYDEAIAGAVDDLLEGDFVSVDLVLDGMHETTLPPVPVQEKPAAVPEATAEPANAVAPQEGGEDPSVANPVAATGASVAVERKAPRSETSETVAAVAANKPDAGDEPAAEGAAREETNADAPLGLPASAAAPVASATAPHVHASAQAKPAQSMPAALIEFASSLLPVIRALAIAMLEILSFPVRFVPPKARDIVDWIALSLVFWVPIVWIFALFIVG
jgi:hypothetical protein